jgi:signal transduction histidine kinase
VHMPARVSLPQTLLMIARALFEARKWPLERLLSVPAATDERQIAALYLQQVIKGPAYIVQAELAGYAAAAHMLALMRAGHHPTAPEGYATMSFLLAMLGRPNTAWQRCGDLIVLSEQRESTPTSALSAHLMRLTIGPLCRPHHEHFDQIEPLHARALEIGERAVAGLIAATGTQLHIEAGSHLREVLELDARLRACDESYGSREMAAIAEYNRRAVLRLLGTAEAAEFMSVDEVGDEEISQATKLAIRATAVWGRLLLGEHHDRLWEHTQALRGFARALMGSPIKARVAATIAIVCSERAAELGGRERRRALSSMRSNLRVARAASEACRENYQPDVDLIRGEIAALRGRDSALRWFERARAAAFEAGSYHLAGLASLRLSAWAGRTELPVIEAEALHFARRAFERWGAWAIVERLDRVELAVELDAHTGPSTLTTSVRSSVSSGDSDRALDVATLLGTMQAISEDLRLEEVITRVLESAIENAGADRGALLLARDDEYELVAEGRDRVMHEFMREGVRLRDATDRLPCSVVNYALRTGPVVLDDAIADPRFASDPYVRNEGVRSLLCMPIHKASARVGVLVLENRLVAGAFGAARLEVLRALMGQAASALDNARLYAALSRSEAQWRSLVDGAPDMITQVDADGRIELINHGWPGHDARESIGQPGDRQMDASSRAAWRAALAAVVDDGQPRELELGYDVDANTASPGGGDAINTTHKRWTMTRLAAIAQASGRAEVTKVLSISTDITERKGLEAQVRQQQRLESIGTFASGVAHEINNPIQGILNYAELIAAQPEDTATVREYSAEIGRESERVATIVRDLLSFSRRDTAQHVERVALDGLVAATLSLVSALLRRNEVRIEIDVPAELPAVEGRPQQIRQILMNLITNARDATVARGAPRSSGQRVITIRGKTIARDDATWVRLSVEDCGTGMSDEVRTQAFDPFFTTKGRDQGTGLGLAVSHGIAREHGGELSFETELGRGTTFHLDLPAATA